MAHRIAVGVALLACLVPSAAAAQGFQASIGLGAAGVADTGDFWGEGLASVAVEGRARVPFAPRFALEPFVTYGRRSVRRSPVDPVKSLRRTEGLYGLIVVQRLREVSAPAMMVCVHYGLTGFYGTTYYPAYTSRSQTVVPASSYHRRINPIFQTYGAGVQKQLKGRVDVRAEGSIITFLWYPLGARASVGLAVRLGGE